jgi:acetate kinase
MGATPQSGLFHNNRVGDFDVFRIPELVNKYGSLDAVMKKLSKESGFLGVSGVSNDLRDVIAAAKDGNKNAQLAIDAFVDNIVGYIGMFSAYMEGLDAIAFTGGIGQHSSEVRTAVLKRLAWLGVELDPAEQDRHSDGKITTDASKVAVYVLKTNEELMVARKAVEFLSK